MDAFNTYKKGADLQFMVDECLNRGKVLQLKKDETLERAGEPARWIGFIKSGYLKYVVTNPMNNSCSVVPTSCKNFLCRKSHPISESLPPPSVASERRCWERSEINTYFSFPKVISLRILLK